MFTLPRFPSWRDANLWQPNDSDFDSHIQSKLQGKTFACDCAVKLENKHAFGPVVKWNAWYGLICDKKKPSNLKTVTKLFLRKNSCIFVFADTTLKRKKFPIWFGKMKVISSGLFAEIFD